jgi:hypothetical protein
LDISQGTMNLNRASAGKQRVNWSDAVWQRTIEGKAVSLNVDANIDFSVTGTAKINLTGDLKDYLWIEGIISANPSEINVTNIVAQAGPTGFKIDLYTENHEGFKYIRSGVNKGDFSIANASASLNMTGFWDFKLSNLNFSYDAQSKMPPAQRLKIDLISSDNAYRLAPVSLPLSIGIPIAVILGSPKNLLSGIEGFFGGIKELADGIGSIDIPVIGAAASENLKKALTSMEAKVLGDKDNGKYKNGLGLSLQKAIEDEASSIGAIIDLIKQKLYDGLRALKIDKLSPDLFSIVVPVLAPQDSNGSLSVQQRYQYDSRGILITKPLTKYNDIELIFSNQGLLSLNIKFAGLLVGAYQRDVQERIVYDDLGNNVIDRASIPIDFNAGIPGIGLDVKGEISAQIQYAMGFGLGFGNLGEDGEIKPGVFLDLSGINKKGSEAVIDVVADFVTDRNIDKNILQQYDHQNYKSVYGVNAVKGTLGFLQMDFQGRASLAGQLELDIRDVPKTGVARPDGRWTLGENLSLGLSANADAHADIYANASQLQVPVCLKCRLSLSMTKC